LTKGVKQLKSWLLENIEHHPIYTFAESQTNFSSNEWKTYNQMLERKSVDTGLNIFDLYEQKNIFLIRQNSIYKGRNL